MKFLTGILSGTPELKELSAAVETGKLPAAVAGLSAVHKAAYIRTLSQMTGRRTLVLTGDEREAQRLSDDLSSMGLRPLVYPLRDFNFRDTAGTSHEYELQRLQVLSRLLLEPDDPERCDCVIACVDAALQYVLPPQLLKERTRVFRPADEVNPDEVVKLLVSCGYERADQIEGPGQFSRRGGILDFFTPSASLPVRMEFWGDEIDTLSYFDPETQRRTDDPLDQVVISPSREVLIDSPTLLAKKIRKHADSLRGKTAPAAKTILHAEADKLENNLHIGSADKYLSLIYEKPVTLFDYFDPAETLLYVSEPARVKDRVRSTLWQWGEDIKEYLMEGVLCRGLDTFSGDWAMVQSRYEDFGAIFLDVFAHGGYDAPIRTLLNVTVRQLSVWGGSTELLIEDLQAMLHNRYRCVVLAGSERSARTVAADLQAAKLPAAFLENPETVSKGTIAVLPGSLSAGMEFPDAGLGIISHGKLASASRPKRQQRNKNAQEIYSLAELTPGDYVVHVSHGIGIFEGIHKIDMHGVIKDYIKVKYAKNDVLYVPVTQLDMVSKYIGPREDAGVKLHRLGGTEWQKAKTRVRSAVRDMAKELIKLYAQRMKAKGHAFPEDTQWQRDFEAHFPYDETDDQLRCIHEIKEDMERQSPMDRLLCGDVGFGKTEVALRAAFKCVSDSKQCAILVPTTILAWQHFQTICKRMEGFPVKIELLSRFRTPKQQEEILRQLRRGEVDIIVGTHRLVSKDVKFHDLGLLIIDEEQRFGVAQKEKIKEACHNVDVLTLSATPIPRTLNMALSGIRDMSVIEEAPHDRHPVQTYVLEHDPAIITDAIRRELRRGGQVYYLHNDVGSIERVAAWVQNKIPEARVGFGHGKMSEHELSEVWRKLIDHEIDVLVCTTIIETGVDVPNANTLIIDNADKLGLSQLHQIRGRVGRSNRRAYAYLTFTPSKVLTEIAQKRLSAIREFTEFGSGFKIAMRDLEIRGAGNILGGEQHGHMESVGYDLYLKLLGEAVRREKGEEVQSADEECVVDMQVNAHIPEKYISSLNQRLEMYRRIADIRTFEDSADVVDELIDRFGDPPAAVKGLIDVALLRNLAGSLGITEVKQQNDHLLLYKSKIDMAQMARLTGAMKGRVLLSAGSRPYISVKIPSALEPLTVLEDTLKLMQEPNSDKPAENR